MGKFTGTHRTDFGTWISNLAATGSTPSQVLVWNAGKYLQTTGADNPWNATPGTSDTAPLTCRRAYHIFLTDGGWNFKYSDAGLTDTSFKTDMFLGTKTGNPKPSDPTNTIDVANYDGKAITALPTPAPASSDHAASPYGVKAYSITPTTDPTADQTRIYRDDYGTRVVSTSTNIGSKYNPKYEYTYYAYPTLADIAFYFWSKDLQTGIANEVIPKIRKSGSETFTSDNTSVTFEEYWNPKNDPAEWQHLVQYTIGYGASASTLGKNTTTSPVFTGGTFGMYDTGFSQLAVGSTKWDDVTSSTADGKDYYDNYRPQEMWHMAINSRGKFYPVSGGDLTGVFKDIFDDIIVDTTAPISGFTSASGSVSRVGTQSYQSTYVAADDANSNDNRWYGYVSSDYINTSGNSSYNPDWGTKTGDTTKGATTADKLDALTDLNNRVILTYDTDSSTGIPFKWDSLTTSSTTASQQMWLNNGTVGSATTLAGDSKGEDRLNFLRGDRTKEAKQTDGIFRNRKSRQGDIVNSAIWYTGTPSDGYSSKSYAAFVKSKASRSSMIYVGGNDGMLHGFSAQDGTEKIAYVPHGVFQNLYQLTDPSYTHRYYVDGSPFSGDVNLGSEASPDWHTYMIGTLAAGGRGYFVLDVTDPTSFSETNASSLVVLDKTAAAVGDAAPPGVPADANAEPYVGHIFGQPTVATDNQQRALEITRTNDGRWALITGNGYNSANETPALLIQYLDGDKSLKVIPTSGTACPAAIKPKGNGLSRPQFLDVNGDGIPDFAYAGDLCGNMWKFDISNSSGTVATGGVADTTNWGVAFSGSPLFTATTASTTRQPITAPPILRVNTDVGGLMVAFGTGQGLTEGDRSDTSQQTFYSVLDNTRYDLESTGDNKGKIKVNTTNPVPATVSGRSVLQAESVTGGTGTGTKGTGNSANRSFWKLTTTEVTYACAADATDCTVQKGWYMDLPVNGERVTTSPAFYDGSSILEIISQKPASGSATASGEEVCAPQPQAAQTFRTLVGISSGKPASPPIMDVNGDGVFNATDAGYARMTASPIELRFSTKTQQLRRGNDGTVDKLAKLPELLVRPNWRQLK
jgi:type IV pilus assembly protein PilY1